jgi:DNA ligase D-like protein (predicted ligase)
MSAEHPFVTWRDRFAIAINAKAAGSGSPIPSTWWTAFVKRADLRKERTKMMNSQISPMLAKGSAPFDNPNYLFEIKWDGERVIAFVQGGKITRLQNRRLKDISKQFPEIIGIEVGAKEAILDGEMVVLGEDKKPSFSKLSQRSHVQDPLRIGLLSNAMPAVYVVFDILYGDGASLLSIPLVQRKQMLSIIPKEGYPITPNFFIEAKGQTLFESVTSMGYEGIMAKRMDSPYLPGKRSDSWLKMKPQKSAICNVIGYTKGEGYRNLLGALVIAQHRENRLVDRGRVGSGISTKVLGDLLSLLHPLMEKNGVTWVDPSLQVEVSYFEETEGGHFRFPVFKRIVG